MLNRLVFSAYQKPKRLVFIKVDYDLIATILSIFSYSLIVSKNYYYGFLIGVIASVTLTSIMYKKKNVYLMYLYIFFIGANLIGFITS